MSGRHRRAQVAGTRRALAAGVPALGVVGVVTALTGADAATESHEADAGLDRPVPAPAPLASAVPADADAPAVTTAASDAARAAGRAGEQQREDERRELRSVVSDVRADAESREAQAAAQGRDRLDAFQRAQESRQQEVEGRPVEPDRPSYSAPSEPVGDCDTAGLPVFGDRADPDEIVDRDCGLTDLFGRQRSNDSWIDGQLLSASDD